MLRNYCGVVRHHLQSSLMRVEDGRGSEFRQVRELAGVTIRQLATATGRRVDHSTISRWERGERDISQATYDRLVSVLADIINERGAA